MILLKMLIISTVLIVGYLILRSWVARFSKVNLLAMRIRYSVVDEQRKRLVEDMAAIGKLQSKSGDTALFHLSTLGLGDKNKEINEIAYNGLMEARERALFPLIRSLDSSGRYRACMLLGHLAYPAALPKLQELVTRPNEDPEVRHVAMKAIKMIQAMHGR